MRSSLTLLVTSMLGACALAAVHVLWLPPIVVDDAFISYRYAANLVRGAGLTFNPGDGDDALRSR